MREMRLTGFMHNYMRMYWGKKILEWSPSPEQAYATTLNLNNKHFLCGRDPNAYANVAWIFGQHDRPWFGAADVRPGPLHERQGPGAEVRDRRLCPVDGACWRHKDARRGWPPASPS